MAGSFQRLVRRQRVVVWPTALVLLVAGWVGEAGPAGAQARDITLSSGQREARVALVIGNGAYSESPLNNPANDARAMAQALRAHGFDVVERVNADLVGMRRAAAEFGERLREGGVAVFYYSGHGIQANGRNYLVPVGAQITSETYVGAETLEVDSVLGQMDAARSRVNVVILDACRNNPFVRRFRSAQRGLAFMQAPLGTFIAYATSPGDVADDGPRGGYGIFTDELLKAIREPLKVEDVFKRVALAVQQRTQRRQTPWTASNLTGDFSFAASTVAVAVPPHLEIREEVRQGFGSLALGARLDDVEVWLGTQRLGQARLGRLLVVNNVPEGVQRVIARKPGYKDWEREVQVTANQRTELIIDIEPLGPAKVVKGDDGAEMVLVPAGEFVMGSNDDDERPPHRVHLDAYYIDRYETTNALYRTFVSATGRQAPSSWNDPTFNGDTQPVVGASWHDADAYCRWVGKRLPTEAEWEKAARGTDGRKYPWGDPWEASRTNSDESKLGSTSRVGSYPTGLSPYDVHDMAGNVWEWVSDWYSYDYYSRSPGRNPKGPSSGTARVLRGGSWLSEAVRLRAAYRYSYSPGYRFEDVGFRCAKGVP
jgi:formylglycine-generating enzyme required for sulfatase activity